MDERELRKWLAKRLKRDDVPEPVWDFLAEEEDLVEAALRGGRLERDDLERVARRLVGLSEATLGRGERPEPTVSIARPKPDLGEYPLQRTLAAAEAVALDAAREPRVRRFRSRFPGGCPLSIPEARRLLASPAAGLLEAKAFERLAIPIIGHRSEIVDRRQDPPEDGVVATEVDLRIEWPGGEHTQTVCRVWPLSRLRQSPALAFVDQTGERYEVKVLPRSVLDGLRELSEWLAKWYGWEVEAATWFALTDEPPVRDPLEASINIRFYPTHRDGRMTFSVEPWVPADLVLRVYRNAQRDLLGRENRPLAVRNLALLRSVTKDEREEERRNPGARRPSRARSMARWNEEHPEAHYEEEWLFARDVSRARRAVLLPDYRFGEQNEEEASS